MLDYRDCVLIEHVPGTIWVTACDSCGSIGEKAQDTLRVPSKMVGFITARVAVLEVLAMGAQVISAAVPIANEPTPTSRKLIEGVRECFKSFGLDIPMIISTEKNMRTSMTAMGIAVNGVADGVRAGGYAVGDKIYVMGRPSVGQEVIDFEEELVDARSIYKALAYEGVRELLPVGSKGIREELGEMMDAWSAGYTLLENHDLDLDKSCGPATAAIIIASETLEMSLDIPLVCIGEVRATREKN